MNFPENGAGESKRYVGTKTYNVTKNNNINPAINPKILEKNPFLDILFFKLIKSVFCFVVNTFVTANIC